MTMAAGLRATAKAVNHPPEPKVGAPVLDPTPVNQLRMLGSGPNRGEATGRCRLAADIRKWSRLILLPVYLTNIAVIW